MKFVSQTLWTTTLEAEHLPRVRSFLNVNGFGELGVSIVWPSQDGQTRLSWSKFYDRQGNIQSRSYEIPIPAGSTFLKLQRSNVSAESRDSEAWLFVAAANVLRIAFGASAARELVLTFHLDGDSSPRWLSDVGYGSPFDTQSINTLDNPTIECAQLRQLPNVTHTLRNKAFDMKYEHERFILLWLAFETIFSSLEGKEKNGLKRGNFFLTELGSQLVNAEVKRIKSIRDSVFKDAGQQIHDFARINLALFSMIQLATIVDCPQRTVLLSRLESQIMAEGAT